MKAPGHSALLGIDVCLGKIIASKGRDTVELIELGKKMGLLYQMNVMKTDKFSKGDRD